MRTPLILAFAAALFAQDVCEGQSPEIHRAAPKPQGMVWSADNGDGMYTNPVLYADYSDPDAIRVGDDFYLVASSFAHWPGLPILHSRDLVNWRIIGHAARRPPSIDFDTPQHGKGVWAPSIRYHNGEYYVYYGDPDRGVYMTKARNPAGPWEELKLIRKVTGWIDTCPFWDDDGSTYLVHAFANSRVGIKSILALNRMNTEGTEILDDGIVVFDGHKNHPTIEGPKFYKRNGFYYIFAPAGGVKPGWQTVLRSRSIFGPYEDKIVLEQGSTKINGPHQGAWVDTPSGDDWFLHFQDRYAYGRIVHLQPMKWVDDWPMIGIDLDKNGIGEPVTRYLKPATGTVSPRMEPQTSDEFDKTTPGLQWQWNANPDSQWYQQGSRNGWIRLASSPISASARSLWDLPQLLLQKMPAPAFNATSRFEFHPGMTGEKAGLMVFGMDYAYVGIEKTPGGLCIIQRICDRADKMGIEHTIDSVAVASSSVTLRVDAWPEEPDQVIPRVLCKFSFSPDGITFQSIGTLFVAREGTWVGAKIGLFATGPSGYSKSGYTDVDWFRVAKPDH
jgi:beta-xylosidase